MNENREPKKYLVAGYVKNALLWKNRNPEEMIAYNRFYFEEQLSEMENMELVDVYVDVTGHKETYKRPEMVRLLKDITEGKVNMIYSAPVATSQLMSMNCVCLWSFYLSKMKWSIFTRRTKTTSLTQSPIPTIR